MEVHRKWDLPMQKRWCFLALANICVEKDNKNRRSLASVRSAKHAKDITVIEFFASQLWWFKKRLTQKNKRIVNKNKFITVTKTPKKSVTPNRRNRHKIFNRHETKTPHVREIWLDKWLKRNKIKVISNRQITQMSSEHDEV